MKYTRILLSMFAGLTVVMAMRAQYPMELNVRLTGGDGSGLFAPYYIASNNHGLITQNSNVLINAGLFKSHQASSRFSYKWGVEAIGGYSSTVIYDRYDAAAQQWEDNPQHPPRVWLQQLYGRADYRSLFIWGGLYETQSALLNNRLSSGDLVEGTNARPIPQVRAGFNNFQPIPFTNGWVEIQGELSYGKMSDNGWIKSHANYYNDHINTGAYYTYKRCYFRSKSSKPFTITLGMQVAGFFGGKSITYRDGEVEHVYHNKSGIKEFFKMLIPMEGEEEYYLGSTLGSWDIFLNYKLPWGGSIKGYLQKPWETGSGIGFLNGFDGLWGLEYNAPSQGIVDAVVVEYLDFTNQSGPIHLDPDDIPGTNFPYHTDGGDDYYNNYNYNAYANYGMSLGTPFLRSPIYNTDGYMAFVDNMVRGFHIGVGGHISPNLAYRVMGSYRKSFGAVRLPRLNMVDDTSFMVEATYKPVLKNRVQPLSIKAALAFDRGKMYGDQFGILVSVNYHTTLCGGKK